jgi:hypothetical protein
MPLLTRAALGLAALCDAVRTRRILQGNDVGGGSVEVLSEFVQPTRRGIVQAHHEALAVDVRSMRPHGSTPPFRRCRVPARGKIRHGDPSHRMAQPGRDVTPCGRRRRLYPLPHLRLESQEDTLGSAWWPAAVDLPPLPVRESPLQDLAQHRRPAAAEGGHEACDLRLRRLVQVDLQAGSNTAAGGRGG